MEEEQSLETKMESYSDTRILNTIRQSKSFGPEVVAMAKKIAFERGILDNDKLSSIEQTNVIKREIELLLKKNASKANILQQITHQFDIKTETASALIDDMAKQVKPVYNKSAEVVGGVFILYIIYVLVKMFVLNA